MENPSILEVLMDSGIKAPADESAPALAAESMSVLAAGITADECYLLRAEDEGAFSFTLTFQGVREDENEEFWEEYDDSDEEYPDNLWWRIDVYVEASTAEIARQRVVQDLSAIIKQIKSAK